MPPRPSKRKLEEEKSIPPVLDWEEIEKIRNNMWDAAFRGEDRAWGGRLPEGTLASKTTSLFVGVDTEQSRDRMLAAAFKDPAHRQEILKHMNKLHWTSDAVKGPSSAPNPWIDWMVWQITFLSYMYPKLMEREKTKARADAKKPRKLTPTS